MRFLRFGGALLAALLVFGSVPPVFGFAASSTTCALTDRPTDEGQFGRFCNPSLISPGDLGTMARQLGSGNRAAQQSVMQQMFSTYKTQVQLTLGPSFLGITNEGLAAVFAATAAYELKPIGPGINSDDLNVILSPGNVSLGILCEGYTALADQLFFLIDPNPSPGVQLQLLGLGREGPTDNHVTMSASGTGVPMFIDPTTDMIALGGLVSLLDRTSMYTVQFPVRDDPVNAPDGFRPLMLGMLQKGTFDYRSLLYAYPGSAAKYYPLTSDFINVVTWDNIPSQQGFFFLTVPGDSSHGVVWSVTLNGLKAVSGPGMSEIVPVNQAVFGLSLSGTLYEFEANAVVTVATGVAEIAAGPSDPSTLVPGPANAAIYAAFMSTSPCTPASMAGGPLCEYQSQDGNGVATTPQWNAVNFGGNVALVGTGDATFMLNGSTLYATTTASVWHAIGWGYDGLVAGYPARLDLGPENQSCTKASPCNGEYYAHTNAADGNGIYFRDRTGAIANLANGVNAWVVSSLRGISVDMLVGSRIYRWDSLAIPMSRLPFGRLREITAPGWSEPAQLWEPSAPASGAVAQMYGWNLDIQLLVIDQSGNYYAVASGTF